jgi:ferrochelatase
MANLGTPDAPTTKALRVFLREFLSDPRVIQLPKWKWQIILNLFILTTRPQKSAAAYREVWTDEGSPLLVISKQQAAKLEKGLRERFDGPLHVAIGMRYGNPSIDAGLKELDTRSIRRPRRPPPSTRSPTRSRRAVGCRSSGWCATTTTTRATSKHSATR